MPRPLIGINALFHAADPMLRLRQRYVEAVRLAGGLPVAIAAHLGDPAERDAEIDAILERLDGLVLTGGDDFHAEPLGLGVTHPTAEATPRAKQDFDLALTRAALGAGLPTLGICFGMQCLGLAGGATLIQDLPSQRPDLTTAHADSARHPVRAREGTKLAGAIGLGPVDVVSRHHQALRTVPPPWIVSAVDDEGLVEAIELPGHPFAVGVQWHPEIPVDAPTPSASLTPGMIQSSPHGALLRALVDAARGAISPR